MAQNVKFEIELYEPMRLWLKRYLEGIYKDAEIETYDSHSQNLEVFLEQAGILDDYPQTIGLAIQIDVLAIIRRRGRKEIAFIEAKKTQLNLHDLGQLWAYCKLCSPAVAFLLSSAGLGSLNKIFVNLQRMDMLNFGDGKMIRMMQIAKWNIEQGSIDYGTLIPKI